jgi:nitrate/nitrite-specific signal transduction histidine kinase
VQAEVSIGEGAARSCCEASVSAIVHPRGWSLGRVVLLYDVTGRKRAEAQILDHQRALATAAEREHLGRELHDGFGQVLGYAKLQIAAARARLSQGDLATADGYLANLEHVVQDAHTDVREFLLAIRTGIGPDRAFTVALREYLREYSRSYGIETAVETASDLELAGLGPAAEVQVLRVIQEALTNARKHAKAALVRVSLEARDHVIVAAICDDGLGFDATAVENDGYGLRFMRDRAAAIGGDLQIHSAPGEGTVVILTVPNRKETP